MNFPHTLSRSSGYELNRHKGGAVFGLFSSRKPKTMNAEQVVAAIHRYYRGAKDKFAGKREIFYLALAWAVYVKCHHAERYKNQDLSWLLVPGASLTALVALMPPPKSIEALGIYILHWEKMQIDPKLEYRFNELLAEFNLTDEKLQSLVLERVTEQTHYITHEEEQLKDFTLVDFLSGLG
jgi:hypothetical protein